MSEYGSPESEGPNQTMDTSDANNSLINKVKSRVSSIFPQKLTQWFSPSTGNSSNGNLRRRRHDSDNDEYDDDYYGQQIGGDMEDSDADRKKTNRRSPTSNVGIFSEKYDVDMPLPKRSRLNAEEDYTVYQNKNLNKHVISSTPMSITINRNRKHLGLLKQQPESTPYNFSKTATSTFLGGSTIISSPSERVSVQKESNCLENRNIHLPERISSRRSLNIPHSSLDKPIANQRFNYSPNETMKTVPAINIRDYKKQYKKQMDEAEEASEDLDDVDEEDEEVLEDDDDDVVLNAEIKIAQKLLKSGNTASPKDISNLQQQQQQITNGLRLNRSSRFQHQDTASESGESQQSVSSHQRPKSGLFNPQAGQKRSATLNGLNFYSHLEGKKSLFSEKNLNTILNNSTLSLNSLNRRQTFNSSLYGSTSALSDSRLLNTTSPFYKGRTTYGGASAYNRYSQQRITPTLIRPSSSLSIASSTNSQDTQNNSGISSTAKRILELMNQFTTPLGDAKKLAHSIKNKNITSPPLVEHRKRFNELDLIEERRQAIRLGKVRTPYSRPETARSNLLPPSNELQVPSMAQLLQLNKLQNSTERVRELANTNTKSILNKNDEYKLPANSNEKSTHHVNKIKQKITTTRQKPQLAANEEVENINLPDIPLPFMKSIPTFDINLQKPQSIDSVIPNSDSIKTKSSDSKSKDFSELTKSKKNQSTNAFNTNIKEQFKSGDSIANHVNKTGSNKFKFSSPINLNGSNSANLLGKSDSINNNFKFSNPTLVDNNEKQNNNSFESISGNKDLSKNNISTTIPQLKTGSVLDALKSPTTLTSSSPTLTKNFSGFGDKFKKPTNQWACEVCLINNKDEVTKCVACETPRKTVASTNITPISPKLALITSTAITPAPNVTKSFGNAFKPKSGTWECDACLVRNNPEVTSCVSCTTPKPGSKLVTANPSNKVPNSDDGFKALAAQQSESKWECSACMTRNESNRSKCACCEQSKPDSNPANENKPKFSFGNTASATKFNFGFGGTNPKEDEVKKNTNTKTDETQNSSSFIFGKSSTTKSDAAPPPVQGGFSFGFKPTETKLNDQNKSNDTTDTAGGFKFDTTKSKQLDSETSANNANKGGFSFGVTSSTSEKINTSESTSLSGFKIPSPKFSGVTFGGTSNKTETKVSEPVSTKTVDKPIQGSNAANLFGVPLTTPNKQNDELSKSSPIKSIDSTRFLSPQTVEPKPTPSPSPSSGFVFGNMNQTSTSTATPLFGASSNTTTTSVSSPLFGLTSSSSIVSPNALKSATPIKSTSLFGESSSKATATTPSGFSTITSTNASITGTSSSFIGTNSSFTGTNTSFTGTNTSFTGTNTSFTGANPSFSATNTSTTTASSSFNTPTNLFAFGGKTEAKPVTSSSALPVFGSSSLNSGKTFTFGASTVATSSVPQTTSSFVFGKSVTQPANPAPSAPSASTSLFGSNNNNNNTTFGSSAPFGQANTAFGQSPTPSFGQPSSAVNMFGSSTPAVNPPAFGSQNSTNQTFGSGSPNTSSVFNNIPTNPPNFAGAAAPTFGGTTNPPTFGSNTSNQPPVFGTSNSFAGSAPGFTPASSSQPNFNFGDVAAKKPADSAYNFNAPAIPTGGFSFGSNSNSNTTKPAFNFTAQSAPSFNFTGQADGLNSSQPFQFGATSLNPGGFNFGGVETPSNTPFQFAASAAANNLFAPTPSPNIQAQQARRKIRTAQRRSTQPR